MLEQTSEVQIRMIYKQLSNKKVSITQVGYKEVSNRELRKKQGSNMNEASNMQLSNNEVCYKQNLTNK